MSIENYVGGQLEGVRKVFYKSGKLAEETNYKGGVKNGVYKKYSENGIVLEETNYENGEYNGAAIFRGTDNQIASQGVYKKGKKVGMWKVFENGKLKDVNMNKPGKKFQKRPKPTETK
jgi:antitoxin component YwqK of YwqJK toxin-antitoxin module